MRASCGEGRVSRLFRGRRQAAESATESKFRVCLESEKENSVAFKGCSQSRPSQSWIASGDGYYYD